MTRSKRKRSLCLQIGYLENRTSRLSNICTMNRSSSTYSPTISDPALTGVEISMDFTGKERDEETGYGYFGARYMDHELMTMWLSVDPMSDKYPSISPYAYCAWTRPTGGDEHRWIKYNMVNNPVKLVDPDGREFNKKMAEYAHIIENYCMQKIDAMNSKINNGEELSDEERSQFSEYQNTLVEIQKLRDDKSTMYCLVFGPLSDASALGVTSYTGTARNNWEEQDIVRVALNMTEAEGGTTRGMYTLAHELKHCYQYYNKETLYVQAADGNCIKAYNTQDLEKAAFRRGNAFGSLARFALGHYPDLFSGTMDDFINKNPECNVIKHR